MRVKLYSKVKVKIEQIAAAEANKLYRQGKAVKILLPTTFGGNATIYRSIPESEQSEELLGEFSAVEFTAPNGTKWINISTPKQSIRINAQTLSKETDVNIFRVEIL